MKLTIDGQEVEAREGQTVLQAAEDAGIFIPHLCAHPDLEPVGGCRQYVGAYGTLGGVLINQRMEVMTDEYKKIPGLYCVGTDACTIYGDSYNYAIPGNTMGFCLNSGRIAGENAAAAVAESADFDDFDEGDGDWD